MLNGEYKTLIISDFGAFKKIKPEWDKLLETTYGHFPFLCHDWFHIWLKHFLNKNKLHIFLVFKNDVLIGIAPFLIKSPKYKGVLKLKRVEFIGNIHSPIRDFIFGTINNNEKLKAMKIIFQ